MKIQMRVTVTGNRLSSKQFVDAILDKMRTKTIPDLKDLFGQTTEGWKDKPGFSSRQWNNPSEIGSEVFVDGGHAGDIYSLVSKGSPPHPIMPKSNGFLRFQPGYKASTSPGFLKSTPSSRSGDFVKASKVDHPGFEARDFPSTIKREYEDTFAADMQDAMNSAAKS